MVWSSIHRSALGMIALIVVLIAVGGCVESIVTDQNPTCGDRVCDSGESCPADCGSTLAVPKDSFRAQYFTDEGFTNLYAERIESAIDHDWGRNPPLEGMPADRFSVRWIGRFTFEEGSYTFTAITDDGMRVWIDDTLILDEWREQLETFTVTVPVSAGERTIRVDSYEHEYGAIAQLGWSRTATQDPIVPEQPPGDLPADEMRTLTFTVDTTSDFMNPERGWMIREPHTSTAFSNARSGDADNPVGYTVVWSYMFGTPWTGNSGNPFRLDNYKASDIPSSLLAELDEVFTAAREAGVKMKVRFAYNYDDSEPSDTSLSWMKRHIEQLAPMLNANKDTIAAIDVGFVGMWGEFHGTTNLVDSTNNWWQEPWLSAYAEVFETQLDRFDEDLMIMMRQPRDDRGYRLYFNGATADRPFWRDFDPEDRFTGEDQSRVGWYNDCLWTDESHADTFNFDGGEGAIDREAAALSGRYAATSGETCRLGGLNRWNDGAYVISDMEYLGGPDHLFRKYWDEVYDKWEASGHYDEISRRLGYRIALMEATIPTSLSAGSTSSVQLTMRNDGFGKVYNPRPLELVLTGSSGTYRIRLSDDARRQLPLAGETVTETFAFTVPNIPTGTYALALALPDPSSRLSTDARYSIRLANTGLWDAARGTNDLKASLAVT